VDGFGPSFPSTDALLKGPAAMSVIKRYIDNRIRRCLSNPAILLLALVYFSSARRPKAVFPRWATRAL